MKRSIFSRKQCASTPRMYCVFIISTLLLIFFSSNLPAQGDLLIFPKRVVFEGNRKVQDLNLVNSGKDTARYTISFVQIRMKEDGNFERITEPDSGQYFADSYVRIFPRNVILAPGEAQLVKLQLNKNSQLTPGEYRSHIYFRAEPKVAPLSLGETEQTNDTTSISVRLIPIYGLTIPLIIRVGESSTKVSLSDLSYQTIEDSIPSLKMVINRTGNMSVYGDIIVQHTSPSGKTTQAAKVEGLAVYTPIPRRQVLIKLEKIPGIDYRNGKLHVEYTPQRDDKGGTFADAEVEIK